MLELPGGDEAVKLRYKKHKQMSCDTVKVILEGFEEWKAFFMAHKKKDDLSDALLLAAVAQRSKKRKRK